MKKVFTLYSLALFLMCVVYLFLPWELDSRLGLHILLNIKLPIALTCLLVGFALCSASAALQVVLKNPLADPGILGIASGASAMAAAYFALVGILGLSAGTFFSAITLSVLLPVMCFFGALTSGFLIFKLARRIGFNPAAVILSGIAISTLLAAMVAWLYLVLPPTQLQNLTFWLMGSITNANWYSLAVALPILTMCCISLFRQTAILNWLFFGDKMAQLKGVNTKKFQYLQLVKIALLVGTAVSIAGSIAFIGLIIPHLLRQIHGYDNQLIVPLSGICGAIILFICAILNEHFAPAPLPVSLITASIGAPVFIWLLLRSAGLMRLRTVT